MAPFGYAPIPNTDSYWGHTTNPKIFCLCVDDFGIKYFSKSELNHLINALQTNYKISMDFSGRNYCGLTIDWNYEQGFVDISMPNYIKKALENLRTPPRHRNFRHTNVLDPIIDIKYSMPNHQTAQPQLTKTGNAEYNQ